MQRAIAQGDYVPECKQFQIREDLLHDALGLNTAGNVQLHWGEGMPSIVEGDVRVLTHILSNALDNAKMHGKLGGLITLRLEYLHETSKLSIVVENEPGYNHKAALDLSAEQGSSFWTEGLPFAALLTQPLRGLIQFHCCKGMPSSTRSHWVIQHQPSWGCRLVAIGRHSMM